MLIICQRLIVLSVVYFVLIVVAPTWLVPAAAAEVDVQRIQQSIDKQVWKPFHDAFENLDGDALNAVYAETVLRATPDGIDTNGVFKQYNRTRFDGSRARAESIALDFWFDSRRTDESTSYEVGFFRIVMTASDGDAVTFYGQFHIVLRKISGRWQITQDWDTDTIAGRPIDATHFCGETAGNFLI